DPDALLFAALPRALGLEPFLVGADEDQQKAAGYADDLFRALDELRGAGAMLRQEVVNILAREFRTSPSVGALREGLRVRLAPLPDSVREPEVRGFISLALNEALSDDEWLDPVVVRLARVGLPNWSDEQIKVFEAAARRLSGSIDRLAALHMARPAGSAVN